MSNVSRNDLLIETDSVAHPSTLLWTGKEKDSRMFKDLPVSCAGGGSILWGVCVCGWRAKVLGGGGEEKSWQGKKKRLRASLLACLPVHACLLTDQPTSPAWL